MSGFLRDVIITGCCAAGLFGLGAGAWEAVEWLKRKGRL
jgi:hypothetical protein